MTAVLEGPWEDTAAPHDRAAERATLGAMMLSARALNDVLDVGITGQDFYTPASGFVFDAITGLVEAGTPVDVTTVSGALVERGALGRIGGAVELAEMLDHGGRATANAAYHARIVRGLAVRRRLVEAAAKIAQVATGPGAVEDIAAEARQAVEEAGEAATPAHSFAVIGDRIEALYAELGQPLTVDSRGLTWGFPDIDHYAGPALPGQLILIGGRPTMGKSTFARDLARHWAFTLGKRVLIHSFEMSIGEIEECLLAAESAVELAKIRTHTLSTRDRYLIDRAMASFSEGYLAVDDSPRLTVAGLRSSIRKHRADVVIVDQLQHMSAPSGKRERAMHEEIGAVSRGLKLLASEQGIPIVACSKLNRGSEAGAGRPPQLSDLRGSGELESDATTVFMPHRPIGEPGRQGETDIWLRKQRTGEQDIPIPLAFQGHYSRFQSLYRGGEGS